MGREIDIILTVSALETPEVIQSIFEGSLFEESFCQNPTHYRCNLRTFSAHSRYSPDYEIEKMLTAFGMAPLVSPELASLTVSTDDLSFSAVFVRADGHGKCAV